MTTTTITNVQALSALIAYARETGYEREDVLAKVEKHLATMSRPSKTEGNRVILPEVVAFIAAHPDGCKARDILAAFPQLRSTSKVVAVCKLGVTDGTLACTKDEKGVGVYTAA